MLPDDFQYTFHEVSETLTPPGELEDLAANIQANGLFEPIIVENNQVIDGRRRLLAWRMLGLKDSKIPAQTLAERMDGKLIRNDPAAFVVAKSMHRSVDQSQRACAAIKIAKYVVAQLEQGKASKLTSRINARASVAEIAAQVYPHEVSKRYIQFAWSLFESHPDLFEACDRGKKKITAANSEARRREKIAATKAKAESATSITPADIVIHTGDCLDVGIALCPPPSDRTDMIESGTVHLVFADPPYNQGIDYGHGAVADSLDPADYLDWCKQWIDLYAQLLSDTGTFLVLISDEYAAEICLLLKDAGLDMVNWIKWYETFGVNTPERFNRTSRHLLYFARNESRRTFNHAAVNRPSARQTKYKDPRATAGGKNLDDVWTDIPRLVGNSAERMPGFHTQLPLALVKRCIEFSTNPGDLVVDPFVGSGTTPHACLLTGRRFIGWEHNPDYAAAARARVSGIGIPACQPSANPIESAQSAKSADVCGSIHPDRPDHAEDADPQRAA